MKLIHCGDIHLDSKMESNLDSEKAKQRREELLCTFERLVEYAAAHSVRAILIAGDMFDKTHIRKSAKTRVMDAVLSNPGIDFLYLKGNHDKTDFLAGIEELPENLKLFSEDEWISYEYEDGVVVTGREISKDNAKHISTNLILDQSKVNIVMLHGQESNYEGPDKTEIINLTEYKNKNIDYLALGHIHKYKHERLDDRGEYAYSGCLEGRGFDECGEKGFVLLDIEDRKVESTFIPFAFRTLHEVDVEIGSEDEMRDVINAVSDAGKNIPERDLLKVVLTGETEVEFDMDLPRIKRNFENAFFFFKVYDRTRIKIDYDSFINDRSLKGEFVRLMRDQDLTEEERSKIVELGMKAIMGEDIGS